MFWVPKKKPNSGYEIINLAKVSPCEGENIAGLGTSEVGIGLRN